MRCSAVSPQSIRLVTASNPLGWTFAELPDGRRVTKTMVDFDLDRADVAVNTYGVVLFYDAALARTLLKLPVD